MADGSLKLWPLVEDLDGNMLFGPHYPQFPLPHYISLDQIARFVGGSTFSRIFVSDTPLENPRLGDAWWDSSDVGGGGQLYLWYSDETSSQWVPATNQPSMRSSAVLVVTPASGETVYLTDDTYVASGSLSLLTIRMPSMPLAGQRIEVCFAAPVEDLRAQDAVGSPIAGAPTSAYGPGAALVFRYVNGGPGWTYWK